jgi:hypothetical protein
VPNPNIDPWSSGPPNGNTFSHSNLWNGAVSQKPEENHDAWGDTLSSYSNDFTHTQEFTTSIPQTNPVSSQLSPASSQPPTVGMSKEEKATEMARRKEERRQVCDP